LRSFRVFQVLLFICLELFSDQELNNRRKDNDDIEEINARNTFANNFVMA
jgi:hypothetical protein